MEISFSHGASQMADLSCGVGTETVRVSAFEVQCNPIVHFKFGTDKNGINNSSNEIIINFLRIKISKQDIGTPKN